MKNQNESDSKIAKYCIEYIADTLNIICERLIRKYGDLSIIFSVGVMATSVINNKLSKKYGALF